MPRLLQDLLIRVRATPVRFRVRPIVLLLICISLLYSYWFFPCKWKKWGNSVVEGAGCKPKRGSFAQTFLELWNRSPWRLELATCSCTPSLGGQGIFALLSKLTTWHTAFRSITCDLWDSQVATTMVAVASMWTCVFIDRFDDGRIEVRRKNS